MAYKEFERLVRVVKALRDPQTGCPWDLEQTHQSLLRFLIEESYEFVHATESQDDRHMEEELGDVLLQVVLHSQLGSERGAFDIESVSKALADKMIRRHPHVFDNENAQKVETAKIKENWEKIKNEEKGGFRHRIDQAYLNFPSLFAANKIGNKTHKIHFDWAGPNEVIKVVQEEWEELQHELKTGESQKKIKEELGDFLFTCAQLSRHLGHDPEEVLREANKKFIRRFNSMELLINADKKVLEEMTQEEMEEYWIKAKRAEKE